MLPSQSFTNQRTLTVRAFDKAGNYTDASIDFRVLPPGAICVGAGFSCALSTFFSQWGWLIALIAIILLIVAYGFIYHLLRWKKRSWKVLKRFEDRLNDDLKQVQGQTLRAQDGDVNLSKPHLLSEQHALEKEIRQIADDVKDEMKKLGEEK
jgi:hypothetical protein